MINNTFKNFVLVAAVAAALNFVALIPARAAAAPVAAPAQQAAPRCEAAPDLNQAAVYTMQEMTDSSRGLELARQAGSDVLIRGWFKWNQACSGNLNGAIPAAAHARGALFGGGITCSALYDRENGITRAQLLDMATRGPDGRLVDAWGQPGVRHGSLSSPAYLDYLFRWCRLQIDAGVDYLFMDENTAALGQREGFDDYSLADFRRYLLEACPQTRGWQASDPRWSAAWKIDLANPAVCPDGTLASFDYRAWLRVHGLVERVNQSDNTLNVLWQQFRTWRDDRAWRALTDRIRAYGRQHGRKVLISGNGIVKYVDLQVMGIWDQWMAREGHIDLAENKIPHWRGKVQRARAVAGARVPVVLFHDWGFGNPPFPWLAVPAADRATWMRTAGAEIYAAGAFFAFPVLGPMGCDAGRDGNIATIARQAAFYQAHRDLYLKADYLGCEQVRSATPNLSLAAWAAREPRSVILHAINRNVTGGALRPQHGVTLTLPLDRLPARASVISPDFAGERPAACRLVNGHLEVALGDLDAYAVAILSYDAEPGVDRLRDPARTVLDLRWARPLRSEFEVLADGAVADAEELSGCLQGRLHQEMHNPPSFLVNAATAGQLAVHVRNVATLGACLEYRVDGQTKQTIDLPDRDGKNGAEAAEYDQTFRFPIPAGRHRLTLDNTGGDWVNVTWIEFGGAFAPWVSQAAAR